MKLPSHRRIQSGRTFDRVYNPADFAPITGPYTNYSIMTKLVDPAVAIVIIAVLALLAIFA